MKIFNCLFKTTMRVVQFKDGTYGIRKFKVNPQDMLRPWVFLRARTDPWSLYCYDWCRLSDVHHTRFQNLDAAVESANRYLSIVKREEENRMKRKARESDIGRPAPIFKPASLTPPAPSCGQCKCKHN